MLTYKSVKELADIAEMAGTTISDVVFKDQTEQTGFSRDYLYQKMAANYQVMKDSVESGMKPGLRSFSGVVGGDALKLMKTVEEGRTAGGPLFGRMMAKAIAVSEYNACMGRIVAAPTAGSCGIIPSVLLSIMEDKNIDEAKVIMSLFTCAGIGMVIANMASISGAVGGCQAECGSASAMAAAAAVELLGGTPTMAANACAISLKNSLGLVCDPVAGLVEIPCIKRNAAGAANALAAVELAQAGITSVIPVDEVIEAMKNVGRKMDPSLKETAQGGLAATPTGKRIKEKITKEAI